MSHYVKLPDINKFKLPLPENATPLAQVEVSVHTTTRSGTIPYPF
jgi:hypothetical protein